MLYEWCGSVVAADAVVGQQESKVESLESIHAARLRSGSEAGTSGPQLGQTTAAVLAQAQSATNDEDADKVDTFFDGAGEQDTESDPYMLPVSHEVALEGARHGLSTSCLAAPEGSQYLNITIAAVSSANHFM